MPESLDQSWSIFIEQYPQFMKLLNRLGKTDWYPREGWTMFIGQFHAGLYMQMYKTHWFNHGLNGVHIETGVSAESLASKTLRIDLHIGHANLFDRVKFNQHTIPRIAEATRDWGDGYVLSTKNLSDRLHGHVRFTKTGFANQLTEELSRWRALGPIIDDGLRIL